MKVTIQREGSSIFLTALVLHGPQSNRIAGQVLRSDGVLWAYAPEGEYWAESVTEDALVFSYRTQGLFAISGVLPWARRLAHDIALILEMDARDLAGDTRKIDRDKLQAYPVSFEFNGKSMDNFEALELAMKEPDSVNPLGTFVLSAPAMRISDPCYEKGSDSAGTVEALMGTWFAESVVGDTAWLRRVKGLRIRHQGTGADVFDDMALFDRVLTAGVDSGQCGFFDEARYPEGDPSVSRQNVDDEPVVITFIGDPDPVSDVSSPAGVAPEAPPLFYDDCCALTSNEQLAGGGILANGSGVVTLTGFGDGGYPVKVLRNAQGLVVAAVIEYIGEADDDDDDEGD